MIAFFTLYFNLTHIYYRKQNSYQSFPLIILWTVPAYLFANQSSAVIAIGLIEWTFFSLYIKYAFKTIQMRIELSVKLLNPRLVLRNIQQHSSVVKVCALMNELFKYNIFIIYFLTTPPIMAVLFILSEKKPETVMFIMTAAIFGFLFKWLTC